MAAVLRSSSKNPETHTFENPVQSQVNNNTGRQAPKTDSKLLVKIILADEFSARSICPEMGKELIALHRRSDHGY